jgi:integrase
MIDALFQQLEGAYAGNTLLNYKTDFRSYEQWCRTQDIAPLPACPEALVDYIEHLSAINKSATIRRKIHSLSSLLKLLDLDDATKAPAVVIALKRANRTLGRAQEQATPLTRDRLETLKAACDTSPLGLRNKVLLQMGYETMRRRSEICQFAFEDLDVLANGKPVLRLRRSKTDQDGQGKLIPISDYLVKLLDEWAALLQQQGQPARGPILRRVHSNGAIGHNALMGATISPLLKQLQAKTDLKHIPPFSGHSFRVGAALDLLNRGVPMEVIMLRGGWRSQTTALNYLRSWVDDEVGVYEE